MFRTSILASLILCFTTVGDFLVRVALGGWRGAKAVFSSSEQNVLVSQALAAAGSSLDRPKIAAVPAISAIDQRSRKHPC
jgi:hypothetical protein